VARTAAAGPPAPALPELAGVHWRPRASERTLTREDRLWTLTTVALVVPFIGIGAGLAAVRPILIPISVIAFAHAWAIPELYAARGAGVVRPRKPAAGAAERRAAGLLGDLLNHRPRELHARTGLVLERGRLGAWLVGEAGALLVRPGGHRVHCYCVKASEPGLPGGDRTAHLLLALREDESGFATVANLAFSGAPWRLRRRLPLRARAALDAAVGEARRANAD
jgi:hypothetical protein